MSSAICLNLDQFTILSSGNELMHLRDSLYQASHHIIIYVALDLSINSLSIGECNTILSAYTKYWHLG